MKIFIPFLIVVSVTCATGQITLGTGVQTCSSVSLSGPGVGAAYEGTLQNFDYGFNMTIPRGLKGWGVSPPAPFHGFTVYLSSATGEAGCIAFEIHVRVELEQAKIIHRGIKINVGGRRRGKGSSRAE